MPTGIQIINDYGTVLIDDLNPTLGLREKRLLTSVATDWDDGGSGTRAGTQPIMGKVVTTLSNVDVPCVAIKTSTNKFVSLIYSEKSGNDLILTFATSNIGDQFYIYHFDRPIPTTNNYGLQVFDSSGRCTFDSDNKVAKVIGSISYGGDGPTTWTDSNSRSVATIILTSRIHHNYSRINEGHGGPYPPPPYNDWDNVWYYTYVRNNSESTIMYGIAEIDFLTMYDNVYDTGLTPEIAEEGATSTNLLFIDVTGY